MNNKEEGNEFSIEDFISKSVQERKKYIEEEGEKITVPSDIIGLQLDDAYKKKEVLNEEHKIRIHNNILDESDIAKIKELAKLTKTEKI